MSEKKKDFIFVCVLVGIFLFFFLINSITPLMGEDYALSAFGRDFQGSVFDAIWLAINRIYVQMSTWNMRLGEQLSIIFGCWDKVVFNVCNSMMALVFIWLVLKFAFKKSILGKWKETFSIISIFSLIIVFLPALGEIFFWRTGSTNYLWGLCFLILFALPIRFYIGYESIDVIGDTKWKIVILTIHGFFAGFTNENTVVFVLGLYVGYMIWAIAKKTKIPFWMYSSFCSLFIGFCVLLFSPSSKIRTMYYRELFGVDEISFKYLILRSGEVIHDFFMYNYALVIGTILVMGIYVIIKVKEKSEIKDILKDLEPVGVLCVSALSCGALVMSPYTEARAFLISDFLMIVCIVYYSVKIIEYLNKKICVMLIGVMLFITAGVCSEIYEKYNEYHSFTEWRDYEIGLQTSSFVWGESGFDEYDRILTTREDYLLGNEKRLEAYYQKDIQCVERYVYRWETDGLSLKEAIGYFDYIEYNAEADYLDVYGWGIVKQDDSTNNEIYVCVNAEQEFVFLTDHVERIDVAEVYDSELYRLSGFFCRINHISEFIGDETAAQIGFYIIDNDNDIFGIRNSNDVLHLEGEK